MKVGFFDSGIGGTCILAAFKRLCPTVETVYLADSEHCPYGNRPPEEIRALADACVRKFLAQGCRMIVVACNTATDGTFHGRLYNETKARFAQDVTVLAVVADEFVEIVERWKGGKVEECEVLDSVPMEEAFREHVERVVRAKIEPLLKAGADVIVLGCTHFPHLKPQIEKVCAGRAEVIDPSEAVARQARRLLEERGWI